MMKVFFCFTIIIVILTSTARCSPGITPSLSPQGLGVGDDCIFRWTITDSINWFTISKPITGSPTLRRNGTSFTYNAENGDIIFIMWNVQLWDAGNYLLITNGSYENVFATFNVFIYSNPIVSIYQSRGAIPATEGDTVELTCNITSTSLPAEDRPQMYCFWYVSNFGWLRYDSSGPAILADGNPVPGHSVKNNGRTLVIDSVGNTADTFFQCKAWEDGSPYRSSYNEYSLSLRYRPYVFYLSPASRRLTVIIGSIVFFSYYWGSGSITTSRTNWSFTDREGVQKNLPLNSQVYYADGESDGNTNLIFNFTSEVYYGSYSITLTNTLGSNTVAIQVLPPGLPDTPSNIRIFYVSHSAISVNWNVMFANSINYKQIVFVRLISKETGSEVGIQTVIFSSNVYNATNNTVFQKSIQPNTSYEIRVWSINVFGRSAVAKLPVRTRSQAKLNVAPETISINGSQATINFILMGDDLENITSVNVACCSFQTGPCVNSSFQGTAAPNQIVLNDIPSGTDYLFELTVYCGVYPKYSYMSAMVKCIKVSRDGGLQTEEIGTTVASQDTTVTFQETTVASNDENIQSLLIAVIVLAVLLGIALLALIGTCIACLCMKFLPKNKHHEMSITHTNGVNDRTKTGKDGQPESTGTEVLESQNRYDNLPPHDSKAI